MSQRAAWKTGSSVGQSDSGLNSVSVFDLMWFSTALKGPRSHSHDSQTLASTSQIWKREKILMAGVSTLTTLVRLRVSVPPDTQDLSLLLWLYHVSMHGSPSSLSMDLSSSSLGAPSYRRTSLRGWVSHYTLLFSVCCCLLHNCLAPILSGTTRAWNVIRVS